MNVSSERSKSFWMATEPSVEAPALDRDAKADVVVVGSGIAGLSTAYELSLAGRSVIVIDRGPLAGGMTARTSGHLTSHVDDYYHRIIDMHGSANARLLFESRAAAIDRIERIQHQEQIDCSFRRLDGFLFHAEGTDPDLLKREHDAVHAIGFPGAAWADRAPIPGINTGRCLRFPRQARFHPLRYLSGLCDAIRKRGGRLFADTMADSIEEKDGSVIVKTDRGITIGARSAIVATNSPINDRVVIHTKQAPYRTYVFAARSKGPVADALMWDTLHPYHYIRMEPMTDGKGPMLIIGGEDHKSGEATDMVDRLARLEAWGRTRFPEMGDVEHRWSGQIMETVDDIGYAGRNPGGEHVFVSTGDSGEGLTHGVIASLVISDLVLGKKNSWVDLYDPKRVTMGAAAKFVRENSTVVTNLAEYVTGGEVDSVDDLKPGQGALIRQGLTKIAAYRDEAGELYIRSATCTHLGCVVHWNPFERCWDCPCHGSQFAPDGTAINGPAVNSLAEVKIERPQGVRARRRSA